MKIVNYKYFDVINFEQSIQVLVVENLLLFRSIVSSLKFQINEKVGDFILSDKDEILDLSKHAILITDIYNLESIAKQVKTKVQQNLEKNCDEDEIFTDIFIRLNELGDKLVVSSSYSLIYKQELSKMEIIKLLDFQLDYSYETEIEQLIDYIDVLKDICKIKLFIFVGLGDYMTEDELIELAKIADYKGIKILMLERNNHGIQGEYLNKRIIDKDLCVI